MRLSSGWAGLPHCLLAGGIVAQYFALLERSHWTHTVPYDDLYGSMSLFAWLLGVTYLGLELFHRQRSVGAFVTLVLVLDGSDHLIVPQAPSATRRPPGDFYSLST